MKLAEIMTLVRPRATVIYAKDYPKDKMIAKS